jgi:hypothetical protein
MGWFFQMSIECGPDDLLARSVIAHFQGYRIGVSDSITLTCSAGLFVDEDGNRWAIATPRGLSTSGINTNEDAEHMTIAGQQLYKRLSSSPPFRYALAGLETEDFRTLSDMKDADETLYSRLPGLVLSKETWEYLGHPCGFIDFRTGYVWRPYRGERPPPASI